MNYPDNLPFTHKVAQIKQVILDNQVVIVCGETGSGKTTQLPKLLLELGFAQHGIIGHTQPRKIAAKTVAKRIGEELGNSDLVGYKVRFLDKTKAQTRIKLMTDGILLQEIQTDRRLSKYSALIIDEAHERSLNIDFILGYLKTILTKRPELKIIITSATIDNLKLSRFYNNAPIVVVEGKTYPVDIIYQPIIDDGNNLNQAVYASIKACFSIELGNVLIFLPGEREIRECMHFLQKSTLRHYTILPLFSRQNEAAQNKVFINDGIVKIIITTNVAETSLTIPGIKFVIDSGLARVKRYSLRNKVEQLQIENISQASSKQRSGRAGRLSHGICIRLFSEDEFNLRPQFTDPEILRSNLANVILKLTSLKLGSPDKFPFIDRPDAKAFNDGFNTLYQLQALNLDNQITPLGQKIAKIPLDCNLARMLIAADDFDCLSDVLIIVAYLAIIDPREYPFELQQLTRERHQVWEDKQSDFMAVLNLWDWYHKEVAHNTRAKIIEKCRYNFVSFLRLRDWHDLYGQLKEVVHNLGLQFVNTVNTQKSTTEQQVAKQQAGLNLQKIKYQKIHQALLSGLLNNIGQKDLVENFYQGINSKKFFIHPTSYINKPKWIVAGNLMQTTKLYAKVNAYIEPLWLIPLTVHLVKYVYANEHWDKKRGEVVASQSTLFGGLILEKKTVGFAKHNLPLAREIFIKQGLVVGELNKNYSWLQHNNQVLKNIEKLEHKLRLPLLMIEDELFDFYANALAHDIVDIRSFEQWSKSNEDKLRLNQQELINKCTSQMACEVNLYPDVILSGGEKVKLRYKFDPTSVQDGMTALIYLNQLNRVDVNVFTWLVSGLIRDKITFILKALPKAVRIAVNPVNEFVTDFLLAANDYRNKDSNTCSDLHITLANYLTKQTKLSITKQDIDKITLPRHLTCHFEIIDNREVLDSDDDLIALKSRLAHKMGNLVSSLGNEYQVLDIKGWINELSHLFEEVRFLRNRHEVVGYTSLVVKHNQVNLTVVNDLDTARINTKKGLFRLVRYQLGQQIKYLEKKSINFKQASIYLVDVYTVDKLLTDSINQILKMSIDLSRFPQTEDKYMELCTESKANIGSNTVLFSNVLTAIANWYHQVKLKLNGHNLAGEIELQLNDLIYPDFLCHVDFNALKQYPRYLEAILIRLDKYQSNRTRDAELQTEIDALYDAWYNYVDRLELKGLAVAKEIYDFKYKIEELRISFFAPDLKTLYKVSAKRLLGELNGFPEFYN